MNCAFSVSVVADCVNDGARPFEHRETNLASSPTLKFRCKIGAGLVSRSSVVVELLLLVLSATRLSMRPIGRSETGGMMTSYFDNAALKALTSLTFVSDDRSKMSWICGLASNELLFRQSHKGL